MSELLLEIVEGDRPGRQLPLGSALELGRGAEASLTLDDEQVSRQHALVEPYGDGAVVSDLGSRNGTYVNEQPIHGPRPIDAGDRVRVGRTVLELRTADQVAAQPSVATPEPQVTKLGTGILKPIRARELAESGRPEEPGEPEVGRPPVHGREPSQAPAPELDPTGIAAREALGATGISARENLIAAQPRGEPAAPPPFAPGADPDPYAALAGLIDTRVKRRTSIAAFAILGAAGLAVLILIGAR